MWWLMSSVLVVVPVSPGAAAIGFDEALSAVEAAADLAGLKAAAQRRREGVSSLGLLTSNPQLNFQPGARTEGVTTGPEGQLTLTQSFNLGGLGFARKARAREEAEVASLQVRALRQQRLTEVALAWLDTWAAQTAAAAAHAQETEAHELLSTLERASTTGGVTRVEVATARAFAAEAAALHLEWEGRRVDSGALLSSLLGLHAIAIAEGPLPTFPEVEAAVLQATVSLPTKVIAGELKAEQQRTEETKAMWATSLQLSAQGGREFPNQWFGNLGLGVTLPVFEQGGRDLASHAATTQQLTGELNLSERRARISRDLVQHELEHSAETLAVVRGQQLPAAMEAASLENQRYVRGEATLIELTVLRRQALAARIAAILAEARFAGARARARELMENP
jgi:outer membrane protein TolC